MNINLITDIAQFPVGMAPTHRIKMIGRSVIQGGNTFRVFTNTTVHNEFNTEFMGEYKSIKFRYLHNQVRIINKRPQRLYYYLLGCLKLFSLIRRMDPTLDIAYVYSQGRMFNFYTILCCRIFSVKIVQEINEWSHNEHDNRLKKYLIEGPIVRKSHGALVISEYINEQVLRRNPKLNTEIIPVLEDPSRYTGNPGPADHPYCFWTGDVNGYLRDVIAIIEASALAWKAGHRFSIVLAGPCGKKSRSQIDATAAASGYPAESISVLGFISEDSLLDYCRKAYFFALPLWKNERSGARFPNKMAQFMFSGKPVITCEVGEVGKILAGTDSALFYKPGDIGDFSLKIMQVFSDENHYLELCKRTKEVACDNFSYLKYSSKLNLFFTLVLQAS